ncbi:hypothetical protein CHUAL_004978 [Chamberlinius hualienensis]
MLAVFVAVIAAVLTIAYWVAAQSPDGQKWIKYILSYLYLRWTKKKPLLNFNIDSKDLGELGVVSLPTAFTIDNPRPLLDNIHATDSIRLWGYNKDGSFIYIQFSRRHDRTAEVILCLNLDGHEYHLPLHPNTNIYNTNGKTFSAAGLTLELLEPLRRWRINFNGYLRRKLDGDKNGEIVSANFNFICVPILNFVSFPEDYNIKYLSDYLSKSQLQPWDFFQQLPLERQALFSILHGIINIENQKREVILRGVKERTFGVQEWKNINQQIYIESMLHNGQSIRLVVENYKNGIKKFLYGYVCPPCNMTVDHMSDCKIDVDAICTDKCPQVIKAEFTAGGRKYNVNIKSSNQLPFTFSMGRYGEAYSQIQRCDVTVNGRLGEGIIHFTSSSSVNDGYRSLQSLQQYSLPLLSEPEIESCKELVVTFKDAKCRSSNIVGGKGASLALMTTVEHSASEKFTVPLGVGVTKTAFKLQEEQNPKIKNALNQLQQIARTSKQADINLSNECEKVTKLIENTPVSPRLREELVEKLTEVFGNEFSSLKFAVRSSAIGEDGEEMSAAGQNETFLGVKSVEQICLMISKCWASQFAFRSVEYKRQNGQLLNSGMGVVVQQMVPAQVAGVLFSRDPLTGSPNNMYITSNYGLGESVVSATADPDTIIIKRSHDDQLTVQNITTGSKKIIIQMSGESGTTECETDAEQASKCSLTDDMAIRLANIALFLEKCFGNGRDIEWAVEDSNIYILQSRPVTTESGLSEYEVMHEFDTPMKTDEEYYTTANVAEVMPGSTTVLTSTSVTRGQMPFFQKKFQWKVDTYRYDPIVHEGLGTFYGHVMFDLVAQKAWSLSEKKSAVIKAFDIGIYGRVLEDDHITKIALDRFQIRPPFKQRMTMLTYTLGGMAFGKWRINNATKTYKNYRIPVDGTEDLIECYDIIGAHILDIFPIMNCHMSVTMASTMWNMIILNTLAHVKGEYSSDQYADFALLVGSCNGAESGNVPASLAELATAISQAKDLNDFCNMSPEDGLNSLYSTADENVKRKFKEFLIRHGHRGLKEFDLSCISWGIDPRQVVVVLQGMLNTGSHTIQKPKEKSSDDIISALKSPLTPFKKRLLKFIMKFVRNSVCYRESAKSMVIKYFDAVRLAYRHLAKLMVKEGYFLDENLIFFLTYEEIHQLITTRSPKLLRRAKQRQKWFSYMDKLDFPEMITGLPKPINRANENISAADVEAIIKGVPVSHGVIEAKARVVTSFHSVNTIQPGEILITHATDIGWSPYFPMLAGVVTEIGGLISHGAVVAREFGLPCIVGVDNATKLFQSGDLVRLNATEGTIMKLKNTE